LFLCGQQGRSIDFPALLWANGNHLLHPR
jgi:hypothetical protein